ncbi:hypothetical protein HY745_08895 [Candidatus Desantisbacteria bacterium]|nr:hypothetical protein [Candidatus Desantisbacteria bacterium]
MRFSALIKNFGGERISDKIVSLVIDDQRVVSQRISIDPFGEKKISMYYTFNLSGIHSGYIETGEDFMPIDNKYFFSIRVIDKIRILSVNGRPGTSPLNDETFYLDTVLNPSGDENSIFKITEIKQNELNKIEFSDFDIYIFSNVSELSPLHIKVLEQCVKGGAGILFFMGDSVLPEKYNEEIFKNGSGIFPSRISYQISSSSNADVQNENYFFINSIELKHPIFSILQDETLKVLQRIPFYSFYRFEYKVEYNSKKINYAVNLNFSESDLESISEEEIIKKIGTGANHLSFSLPVKNFTGPVLAGWFKGEIWKILFIVLLLLIVIETLVANHFRKGV